MDTICRVPLPSFILYLNILYLLTCVSFSTIFSLFFFPDKHSIKALMSVITTYPSTTSFEFMLGIASPNLSHSLIGNLQLSVKGIFLFLLLMFTLYHLIITHVFSLHKFFYYLNFLFKYREVNIANLIFSMIFSFSELLRFHYKIAVSKLTS